MHAKSYIWHTYTLRLFNDILYVDTLIKYKVFDLISLIIMHDCCLNLKIRIKGKMTVLVNSSHAL